MKVQQNAPFLEENSFFKLQPSPWILPLMEKVEFFSAAHAPNARSALKYDLALCASLCNL